MGKRKLNEYTGIRPYLLTMLIPVMAGINVSGQLQMPDDIIFGTVYNLFHEEYSKDEDYRKAVHEDIQAIKEANLNTMLVFPMSQWNTDTKELKWDRTDYLVGEIEKAGLDFAPIIFKQEQCSHWFPIWKFEKFPDIKKEHLNRRLGRSDVDFMEPGVYPLVEDYFRQVIQRYGSSPNLSFYNVWNEPHYQSHSELAMENFRKWLKNKYGSLDAISVAWSESYTDWSQVDHRLADNWASSMSSIDYTLFKYDYTTEILKKLVNTLRQNDSIHPAIANSVNTPLAFVQEDNVWQNDNFKLAEGSDIHGISYYPDLWERVYDRPYPDWLYSFAYNTFRCAAGEKPYILTELVSGPQNGFALNAFYSYEDMEKLTWSAFANGCKGILYWKWKPFMRGRQSLGRGLQTIDGKLADRGRAVKDIGKVLEKYGKEIYAAKKVPAQTAILLDMTGLQKTQRQTVEGTTTFFMNESLYGTFKSLFDKNIGVDLVRSDREPTASQLAQYKVIFLPFQVVMRENVAKLLRQYVQNGGTLVADARTATINELDFGYRESPGAGLTEVFGVRRTDFYGEITEYQIQMVDNNHFSSLLKGMKYTGKYFREKWELAKNTEILSRFRDSGEPALTVHAYGKGFAYLSAVPLGGSYYDHDDNQVYQIIQAITLKAGVKAEVGIGSGMASEDLSLFKYTHKNLVFIYALNYSDKHLHGEISIEPAKTPVEQIKNILSEEELAFTQKGKEILIELDVPSQKVAVLRVEMEQESGE
jgi:beta-galactosidase